MCYSTGWGGGLAHAHECDNRDVTQYAALSTATEAAKEGLADTRSDNDGNDPVELERHDCEPGWLASGLANHVATLT